MQISRTLRTALAAVLLTGGLGVVSACTVNEDDPDTVIREDDGGADAPDVNDEDDADLGPDHATPDIEQSPAG